MKKIAHLSLLLVAAIVLVPVFVVTGCQNLGAPRVDSATTAQTTASESESMSTAEQTTTQETTVQQTSTTKKPVAQTTTTASGLVHMTPQVAHVLTRYEDTDPHLIWTGTWKYDSYSFYSGGRGALTQDAGSSVTIKFSGTSVAWIGIPWESYGIARVTLDGGAFVALVDCYDPANVLTPKVLWESGALADGSHTLRIECTNTKNPGSQGYWINVDAFGVFGTIE